MMMGSGMMHQYLPLYWPSLFFLIALIVVPFWKIFPRAGWPASLSLIMLIPLVQLIMLYILAFKKWPGDKP